MLSLVGPQRNAKTCTCGGPVVGGKCVECHNKRGVRQRSPARQAAALPTAPATAAPTVAGARTPAADDASARTFAHVPVHSSATDRPRMRIGLPGGADERHAASAADAFERVGGAAWPSSAAHTLADPSPPMRDIPGSVLDIVRGEPGHPLEQALRGRIESHLGADLAAARIHTGARPAASARGLGARAYTVGHHVVFSAGQFAPATQQGRRLLVHELAHVAQQSAMPSTAVAQLQMDSEQPTAAGEGAEQAPAGWQGMLVHAIASGLQLPALGAVLVARFGQGIGKELGQEGPGALARLASRVVTMTPSDYLQMMKGYVIGLGEGIVSPITDLFGLGVFGEQILNVVADVVGNVLGLGGKLAAETEAVRNAANRLLNNVGQVWERIKSADLRQLASDIFSGAGSLPAKAGDAAERFGAEAGQAIIAGVESPWEKEQPEEAQSGGGFHPLASIQSYVGGKVKQLVGNVPWAKVGEKVGYAIGFALIQVIILVFTEGIGNAIEEGAAALGRFASSLGKLGKAVGTAAEFLGKVGKAISWIENLISKVIGAALKPLEKLLKPILEPLTDLLGSLRTWLRKLFGVVEKEGPALEEAAAKAVSEADKHVPAPPPPVEKPAPHQPAAQHKPPTEHKLPEPTPAPASMGTRRETVEEFRKRGGEVRKLDPGPVPEVTGAEVTAVKDAPLPPGYEDLEVHERQTRKQANVGLAEDHHIATKYLRENRDLFKKLGISIDSDLNLIKEFPEHAQLRGWYDWKNRKYDFKMRGHHPEYNAWVTKLLKEAEGPGLKPDDALKRVTKVLERLGEVIRNNPEVLSHGPKILKNLKF
jgi:hypothetical protein